MKIKGITLISLIITIIVIVILAGVGISTSLSLISGTKESVFTAKMSKIEEIIQLRLLEEVIAEEQGKPVENEIMAESAKVLVAEFNDLQPETKQAIIEGRNQAFDSTKENYTEEEIINLFKIGEDITKDAGYASIYDSNVGAVYKIEPIVIDGKAKVTTGNSGILRSKKVLSTQNITNSTGNIVKISAGEYHSLAIDKDGYLWAWGRNNYGQLGNGNTTNQLRPVKIKEDTQFKEIAAINHTLAIDKEGKLWTWGLNNFGQLGTGNTTNYFTPQHIATDKTFKAIAGGTYHSLALDTENNLWVCGWNNFGQLGDETKTDRTSLVKIKENIAQIASGNYHSLAIDKAGKLWVWGYNAQGQLGTGNITDYKTPQQIVTDKTFKVILGGYSHSLAIDTENNLWACGENRSGQLGDETTTNRRYLVKIKENITKISTQSSHNLAIDKEGKLWVWGNNNAKLLGTSINTQENIPTEANINKKITEVAAGFAHSLILDENGNIYACGSNEYGQLGIGEGFIHIDFE